MKNPQEVASAFSITAKPELGEGVVELNIAYIPGEHPTTEDGGKSHAFASVAAAAEFVAAVYDRLGAQVKALSPAADPDSEEGADDDPASTKPKKR